MKIIYKDGHVDECPQDQELHVIRHTAAHIMAQAIKRLYPQADFAFGPATENGFYYDVDLGDQKLSDEDLANIEKEMRKIVKENLPIKPFILPRAEAVKLMEERKENYKIEHMADLADETEFSFFQQGEYVDMCIGPHLTYTKALKAFKITQQSGAYWKNDKENKMLTRINGVAFHNQAGRNVTGQAGAAGHKVRLAGINDGAIQPGQGKATVLHKAGIGIQALQQRFGTHGCADPNLGYIIIVHQPGFAVAGNRKPGISGLGRRQHQVLIPEIAAAGGWAVAQRGQQFVTVRAVKEIEITGFYIANAVLQVGQDILLGQVAAQRAAGIVILGAGGQRDQFQRARVDFVHLAADLFRIDLRCAGKALPKIAQH